MGDDEGFTTYEDTAQSELPSEPIDISLKDKMYPKVFQWYGDKYNDIIDFEASLSHDDAFMMQSGLYTDKQLHYMFGNINDFHQLLILLKAQRAQGLLLMEKMKVEQELGQLKKKEHGYIG